MKRFSLPQFNRLSVVTLVSVSILLLLWVISPAFAKLSNPQSQVFEQVWQTVNGNFYDPKFHGVDWKALREKYRSQVAQASKREEVAVVINQMLSELKTSHTHFYTQNDPAYYQLLGIFKSTPYLQRQLKEFFPESRIEYSGIGAFTKDINGKIFISAILDSSPAAEAGLKVGDQLLSVNNKPYQPIQSFTGKAGQKVTLLIQRTSSPNSRQQISVTPKMLDATTMFLEAQYASTQLIERNGKKIGYVHIWCYAGDQYQQMLEQELIEGSLKDADGIVLDLRDGWGGARLNYLNIFTAKKGPSLTYIQRDGTRNSMNFQWGKPVVILVNEGTRSGKEVMAFGFQQDKIGPVIGSRTAGAVVAGSPFLMQDGSLLLLAVADLLVDGQRLEGKGVTPNISVPFSLKYAQGVDPQKEQAIETMLAVVKQQKTL